MKRRSQPKSNRTQGRYSMKMETGNFMYGGFTNHCKQPHLPPRKDHRTGGPTPPVQKEDAPC